MEKSRYFVQRNRVFAILRIAAIGSDGGTGPLVDGVDHRDINPERL
ncbi:MAG: hypothetical protein RLZZ568_3 [Cyanobacteriota bacterium]|jgi:hypothetical protein